MTVNVQNATKLMVANLCGSRSKALFGLNSANLRDLTNLNPTQKSCPNRERTAMR